MAKRGHGHGKSMVWQDYQTAFEVCFHNGINSLDEQLNSGEPTAKAATKMDFLEDEVALSPEEILIRKDAFLFLSSEAKEIVSIIFNAPAEVLETFTSPKYNCIHKKRIGAYLIKEKKWPTNIVCKCFDELKSFCSVFY
jgi:hypothetical protein